MGVDTKQLGIPNIVNGGTNSNVWQIDVDGGGPKLKWDSSYLQFRNSADSDFYPIQADQFYAFSATWDGTPGVYLVNKGGFYFEVDANPASNNPFGVMRGRRARGTPSVPGAARDQDGIFGINAQAYFSGRALGSIRLNAGMATTIAHGNGYHDGDYLDLDDGTNTYRIILDTDGSETQTATHRPVNVNDADSLAVLRQAIADTINAAAVNIVAVVDAQFSNKISLEHTSAGTVGNNTITQFVNGPGTYTFTLVGMEYGTGAVTPDFYNICGLQFTVDGDPVYSTSVKTGSNYWFYHTSSVDGAFLRSIVATKDGVTIGYNVQTSPNQFWNLTVAGSLGLGVDAGKVYLGPSSAYPLWQMLDTTTTHLNAALQIENSTADALDILPYGTNAGETGEIRLRELVANGSAYVAVKAPDALAASTVYTLPSAFPAGNDYALVSSTSGVLSWAQASGSGTVNSGDAGHLAYYSGTGTTVDDAADLYWDSVNSRFGVGSGASAPAAALHIYGPHVGGIGVVYVSGPTNAYVTLDAAESSEAGFIFKENTNRKWQLKLVSDNLIVAHNDATAYLTFNFSSAVATFDADVALASGRTISVNGLQVVGARQAHINDPSGGSTVDSEARTAIASILNALEAHGLVSAT